MAHRGTRIATTLVVAAIALGAVALAGCQPADVKALAADAMAGRDNDTPGSASARSYIVDRLAPITTGANPEATGDGAYLQPFDLQNVVGTNIVAVIPGTDLADQYVMVGAHYDHKGSDCQTSVPGDVVCNGATDNASGVSAVLALADDYAAHPPRRSLLLALWDAEEDGRSGSKYYAAHPLVPLAKVTTYVNIDIQGSRLLPHLSNDTFAVASESGGPVLQQVVNDAARRSPLDVRVLSAIFGAGYSDQSSFTPAHVPVLFLTDSAAGCYHTSQDDTSVVDWGKLERQRKMLVDIVGHLASDPATPTWTSAPQATFEDVVQFKKVVDRSYPDRYLHLPGDVQTVVEIKHTVDQVFADGKAAFESGSPNTFLLAALNSSNVLERDPCRSYLPGSH